MPDLHHQIPVNATPEKVYASIATEKGMRSWWTADTQMDEKVGGKAEFGFGKRQMVFRMEIEKLEPGKRVQMSCHGDHPEWNGTTLTWKVDHENGATMLRFEHGGWKSVTDFFAMCNSTWGELMFRLKDFAEGKDPGPHWRE
jgi:uncharacterized protein YndB with AHSA1/START domain